jgi:monofunctional biosynthetic peptidoglycan transglycosylase
LFLVGLFWLVSVLLFRFINPPITPLMVIRSAEYLITDKPLIRQWDWVPLSEIPLPVQQAVVAAEDARFMDHWGVDFSAVEDAMDESGARKRPRGAGKKRISVARTKLSSKDNRGWYGSHSWSGVG